MLTYQDEKRVREILKEEVPDILKTELLQLDKKLDKVLKIVTKTQQELVITQKVVKQHDKRINKVEKKLEIPSPKLAFI